MAISETCPACAYEFKVKDELSGRKIRCPKCKGVLTVGGGETATAASTKNKAAPALRDEDDNGPAEEERPRKKKRKKTRNNRGMLIGVAIGGAVLLGVGAVMIVMMSGGNAGPKAQPVKPPAARGVPVNQVPQEEPEIIKKDAVGGIARSRERTNIENDLRQLGLAYRQFEVINNRGPKDQKELASYYQNAATINDSLTNKWITFIWGVNNRDGFPDGSSNTMLAFETNPDRAGNRFALMGDGSVQTLDDATFQKTPKAKGK